MNQRGFVWWVYLIIAGGVLGALFTMYTVIDSRGYTRGANAKQVEWDTKNREAAEALRLQALAVGQALMLAEKKQLAAERLAKTNETKWQETRRELKRKGTRLAVAEAAQRVPASGVQPNAVDPAADDRAGVGIRFTFGFVQLYDSAWTGQGGEPVFDTAARPEGPAGPDTASPYGPDDILDIHGENAKSCSADRRNYRTLMDKIEDAAKAWDEAQ